VAIRRSRLIDEERYSRGHWCRQSRTGSSNNNEEKKDDEARTQEPAEVRGLRMIETLLTSWIYGPFFAAGLFVLAVLATLARELKR
jgi:hypothetical protein